MSADDFDEDDDRLAELHDKVARAMSDARVEAILFERIARSAERTGDRPRDLAHLDQLVAAARARLRRLNDVRRNVERQLARSEAP